MISDKVLPSFYAIEVEGSAVESVIAGDFGIERIAFGSGDFATDLLATGALKQVLDYLTSAPHLCLDEAVENIEFNPEFFPSIEPLALSEEQKQEQEDAREAIAEMQDNLAAKGQAATIITRFFDPLGDFVTSRWTVESPAFKIQGKVVVNPQKYLHEKAIEEMQSHMVATLEHSKKYQQVMH